MFECVCACVCVCVCVCVYVCACALATKHAAVTRRPWLTRPLADSLPSDRHLRHVPRIFPALRVGGHARVDVHFFALLLGTAPHAHVRATVPARWLGGSIRIDHPRRGRQASEEGVGYSLCMALT